MRLFERTRPLNMAWGIRCDGYESRLVASAHFSRYTYQKRFVMAMKDVQTVLFEGPLDDASMERVRIYGATGTGQPQLIELLDGPTIDKINRRLKSALPMSSLPDSFIVLQGNTDSGFVQTQTTGLRPWMAFFVIWAAYLKTRNWKHSTDMEAFSVARTMHKEIRFLETIEEQLAAMDGIPVDGIVRFLADIDNWDTYTDRFSELFAAGDLKQLVSSSTGFPTRCKSIVTDRDPVMFERMRASVDKGKAMVLVGTIHVPGIIKRFSDEGYEVTQAAL